MRSILLLVSSFAILIPARSLAQENSAPTSSLEDDTSGTLDDEARGLFLAGRSAFEGGRFEEALAHFRRAYELSDRPELLFNVGVSADRLRRDDEAREAFEVFLTRVPDAENREEIEGRLRVLRARAEAAVAPAPLEPSSSGPGVAPFIVAGGGAALAVVGAVLFGVAASSASTVSSAAGVEWSTVSADYDRAGTFSIAGAILVGVGGAVLATGLVWAIAGSGGSETAVAAVPGGAVVRGRF